MQKLSDGQKQRDGVHLHEEQRRPVLVSMVVPDVNPRATFLGSGAGVVYCVLWGDPWIDP